MATNSSFKDKTVDFVGLDCFDYLVQIHFSFERTGYTSIETHLESFRNLSNFHLHHRIGCYPVDKILHHYNLKD